MTLTVKRTIEKDFGAGALLTLAESAHEKPDVIPTGSKALDQALGVGGLPLGRIVEIFGPESSGKTTLVQHIIASAQAKGLVCAFMDAEHGFDPEYAKVTGVHTEDLLLSQPSCGEEALEIVSRLVDSGEVSVVVVDSVAALTPKAELDGEMGQQQVGLLPRMMGQAMRKLQGPAYKNKVLIVFVNQIREKVGVLFGSPETQPGGRALKFAASVRIRISRISTEKKTGQDPHEQKVKAKIVKNKMAPPYKETEFAIVFGKGIRDLRKRK